MPNIDVLSHRSRFTRMNGTLKVYASLSLIVLATLSRTPYPPLILLFIMGALTIWGGVRARDYLSLMSLPAAFLLLGGLAILWNYSAIATGIVNIRFFGGYLILTAEAKKTAILVMSRALASVSCLYFLSLSTPMSEILSTLRRAHLPPVVIELTVLMYRYIFIMLATYHSMKDSAASRLGFGTNLQALRTTGKIYGNLLASSYRKAGGCFDAMESRCYNGKIRFLETAKMIT
ncbi:MAG: cobalt ECF transporter T component CbiQ, partial [Angelakisella sp.]